LGVENMDAIFWICIALVACVAIIGSVMKRK
jgi:hypothetical protein